MDVKCLLQEMELSSLNSNYTSMSILASALTFLVHKFGLAFTNMSIHSTRAGSNTFYIYNMDVEKK
jgi:hypothetical protein